MLEKTVTPPEKPGYQFICLVNGNQKKRKERKEKIVIWAHHRTITRTVNDLEEKLTITLTTAPHTHTVNSLTERKTYQHFIIYFVLRHSNFNFSSALCRCLGVSFLIKIKISRVRSWSLCGKRSMLCFYHYAAISIFLPAIQFYLLYDIKVILKIELFFPLYKRRFVYHLIIWLMETRAYHIRF